VYNQQYKDNCFCAGKSAEKVWQGKEMAQKPYAQKSRFLTKIAASFLVILYFTAMPKSANAGFFENIQSIPGQIAEGAAIASNEVIPGFFNPASLASIFDSVKCFFGFGCPAAPKPAKTFVKNLTPAITSENISLGAPAQINNQTQIKDSPVAPQAPATQTSQTAATARQYYNIYNPTKEIQNVRTVTNNTNTVIVDQDTKSKVDQLLRQLNSDRPNYSVGQEVVFPSKLAGESLNINADNFSIDSSGNATANGNLIVQGNFTVAGSQTYSGGGIRLADSIPADTAMSLYNDSGTLKWNGAALALGSSVSGTAGYLPKFTSATVLGNSSLFEAGGNVGIGTAAPGAALSIGKASNATLANIAQTASGDAIDIQIPNMAYEEYLPGLVWTTDSNNPTKPKMGIWGKLTASGSYLQFGTTSAWSAGINNTAMTIDYNGKVGIGTTSPASALDVSSFGSGAVVSLAARANPGGTGSSNFNSVVFDNTYGAGNFKNQFSLRSAGVEKWSLGNDVNGTGAQNFYIYSAGTGTRFFIDPSGYVGIGTAAPGARLSVYGGGAIGSTYATTTVADGNFIVSGNVGIGTTNPGYKLDVMATNSAIAARLYGQKGASSNNAQLRFAGQKDGELWTIGSDIAEDSGTQNFEIYGLKTTGAKFVIQQGGNVGIGTTSPGAKLEVAGNALINSVSVDNSFNYDNDIYFAPQAYFEAGSVTFPANWSANIDGFTTYNNTSSPFGKIALSSSNDSLYSGYIPVQAGESLYGEITALREVGASGTAGTLYYGIERYDKDKNSITSNSGTTYFVAAAATIPADGNWHTYSGTTALPTSHTIYNGSDGGPVRYVRVRVLVNYSSGTIPTYWGGILLRRVQPFRDFGNLAFGGNVGIGTISPGARLDVSPTITTTTDLKGMLSGLVYNGATAMTNYYGHYIAAPTGTGTITNKYALVTEATAGNVGVGITNPTHPLEVNGLIKSTGLINNSYPSGVSVGMADSGSVYGAYADLRGRDNPGQEGWLNFVADTRNASATAGQISFGQYNGSSWNTRLAINKAGNVGIGTTAPTGRMQVVGIDNTSSNFGLNVTNASSTSALYVRNDGNVGIGTTAPSEKLEIGTAGSGSRYINLPNSAGETVGIKFGDAYNTWTNVFGGDTVIKAYHGIQLQGSSGNSSSSDPYFQIKHFNTTDLVIKLNGNVGIGTTSPLARLDVNPTVTAITDYTGIKSNMTLNNAGTMTNWYGAYIAGPTITGGGAITNKYAFVTEASAGNVGIGTTAPAYKLDVNGAINGTSVLINGVAVGAGGTQWASGSGGVISYTGGNVGIGTTSPVNMLDVGSATNGGNAAVNATYGADLAPALTDGNWTVGAGWENPIVGPGLIKNADGVGTQTPSAATNIVAGTTYQVTVTVSSMSPGNLSFSLGGQSFSYVGSAGTYTAYVTANSTAKLVITPSATGSRFTVSAISIKAMTVGTGNLTADGSLIVKQKIGVGGTSTFWTINGSSGLNGPQYPLDIIGKLRSQNGYVLGGDMSLLPIVGGQSAISTWYGLQLVGNRQNSVDYSPSNIGNKDDASVIIPNQQAAKIGLIVQGASAQTGNLFEWRDSSRNGLGAINSAGYVGIGTTSPRTILDLGDASLGSEVSGQILTIGRNTYATTTSAGAVDYLSKAGTHGYVWQDAAGKIRIGAAAPTNTGDTGGAVLGDQSSTRETKQDITDYLNYNDALQMVLDSPLHYFRYKNEVAGYGADSPLAKNRIGFIADEVNPAFMWDNTIDQVSVNGILMASIKAQQAEIEDLKLTLNAAGLINASTTAAIGSSGNGIIEMVRDAVVSLFQAGIDGIKNFAAENIKSKNVTTEQMCIAGSDENSLLKCNFLK
jgi:hypothetical protein